MNATYFISDLHLHENSTITLGCFLKFLKNIEFHADALYILGDLFDVWFGDDLSYEYVISIQNALSKLSERVPIYLMQGNRDFLLGQRFASKANCQLLVDPCTIMLYEQRTLLTHGDLLCTQDHQYQKFRSFIQSAMVRRLFISMPKSLRTKLGQWIRKKIRNRSRKYFLEDPQNMDVSLNAVEQWMELYDAENLIHGHTHKPNIHAVKDSKRRIVLGDWGVKAAKILQVGPDNHYNLLDLQDPNSSNNVISA